MQRRLSNAPNTGCLLPRVGLLPGIQVGEAREPGLNIWQLAERRTRLCRVRQRRRDRQIRDRQGVTHDIWLAVLLAVLLTVVLAVEALVEHGAEAAKACDGLVDLALIRGTEAHHGLDDRLEQERAEVRREVRGIPELPSRHFGARPLLSREQA